jgi:hypothetical protein
MDLPPARQGLEAERFASRQADVVDAPSAGHPASARRATVEEKMTSPTILPTRMRAETRLAVTCLAFRPVQNGVALLGYVDLHLPKVRMRLLNCPVFQTPTARWVGLPAAPQLDGECRARLDRDGRVVYRASLEFDDPGLTRAFSDAAIRALLVYAPDAFDGKEGP